MRIPSIRVERYEGEELTKLQKIHGYSYDEYKLY